MGNALVLPPNSTRIMQRHYGIDLADRGMVFYRKGQTIDATTLQLLNETDGEELAQRLGSPLFMGTRAIVLRSLLVEALKDDQTANGRVKIVYGADIVDYV